MDRRTHLIALSALPVATVMSGAFQIGSRRDSLQGVWKPVETGAGPNTTSLVGLAIFTETHYSVMYFSSAPERPDIVDVSTANADEMRVLWAGWAAHTGSYEVNGDLVTIHPSGAKSPVVMRPGANEVYRVRVEADTLTWTQQRNARGVTVTNAPTTKFVRVE